MPIEDFARTKYSIELELDRTRTEFDRTELDRTELDRIRIPVTSQQRRCNEPDQLNKALGRRSGRKSVAKAMLPIR